MWITPINLSVLCKWAWGHGPLGTSLKMSFVGTSRWTALEFLESLL